MIGRNTLFGNSAASLAPAAEPINAGIAIDAVSRRSGFTLRKYAAAENDVPKIDGTLFVPRIIGIGLSEMPIKSAGS